MEIRCLKQSSTKVYEQKYDIDPCLLDLCYVKDSYMSMFYKSYIDKNVCLEMLPSDTKDFIDTAGTDRISSLYDAEFAISYRGSFRIENIYYPPREVFLKKFAVE